MLKVKSMVVEITRLLLGVLIAIFHRPLANLIMQQERALDSYFRRRGHVPVLGGVGKNRSARRQAEGRIIPETRIPAVSIARGGEKSVVRPANTTVWCWRSPLHSTRRSRRPLQTTSLHAMTIARTGAGCP